MYSTEAQSTHALRYLCIHTMQVVCSVVGCFVAENNDFFTRTDTSNTTYAAAHSSDTLIAFVGHRIVSPDSVYICLILIETDTNKELLLIKRRQKLHTH